MRIKDFKQMVIISHDDTFNASLENVIEIEKTEGKSVVRRRPGYARLNVLLNELSNRKDDIVGFEQETSDLMDSYKLKLSAMDTLDISANDHLGKYSAVRYWKKAHS